MKKQSNAELLRVVFGEVTVSDLQLASGCIDAIIDSFVKTDYPDGLELVPFLELAKKHFKSAMEG